MIYVHSLERAARYYPNSSALCLGEAKLTFRELHNEIRSLAGGLVRAGFNAGDRLGLLLPNGPTYIKFAYACSWLGITAVPINTRLSIVEIDHLLADAAPRGLVRHSSLPTPTARLSWELVADAEPFTGLSGDCPDPCYDPEALLALIYTSGTTGRPKGVIVTHANVLADVHNFNYWTQYKEGGVYLHAAPIFHIADFPALFAAPAFGACQIALSRFTREAFCQAVDKQRVNYTVLVPTMISTLTQYEAIEKYDLSSLEVLAYGGSPMAP